MREDRVGSANINDNQGNWTEEAVYTIDLKDNLIS